ncbi:hypothetical protein [Pseudonocardia dioxanivorans]|nr:hypothetical protein [Pseudonocardia dioxanivorans]
MIFAIVTVVGGLLTAIGSFLAWVTVQAPIFGSISVAGTEGDGKITLVLGILVLIIGVLRLIRPSIPALVQRLPIVLGIIAAALGIYVIIRLGSQIGQIEELPGASVSVGFGLIMTIVGAVVSVVGGIVVSSQRPTVPGGVAGLGPVGR